MKSESVDVHLYLISEYKKNHAARNKFVQINDISRAHTSDSVIYVIQMSKRQGDIHLTLLSLETNKYPDEGLGMKCKPVV